MKTLLLSIERRYGPVGVVAALAIAGLVVLYRDQREAAREQLNMQLQTAQAIQSVNLTLSQMLTEFRKP